MNIEHISVSRSKSFKQCKYYYKYKYHLKVPNPGVEQFYFTYGKIIHKIAETFVETGGAQPLGTICTEVLRGKIPIEGDKVAPPLPDEYRKRMPGHLRSIQLLTEQIGTSGIVEHKFRYDLDPPNEKFVTGFIDRLIMKDDKAFILDYKTTKKGPYRVNKRTILEDLQLRCYARVVQREFGIPAANIKCALYYLEGGNLIAASYSDESLKRAETELLDAYNDILESDPDKVWGSVGQHCARCEYNVMCPFYSVKNPRIDGWDGQMAGGWD